MFAESTTVDPSMLPLPLLAPNEQRSLNQNSAGAFYRVDISLFKNFLAPNIFNIVKTDVTNNNDN
jgi:hypothetical protein